MKILILSCSPNCYSTRRLRQAAEQRGHYVRVLNTLRFSIFVEPANPQLHYCNEPLEHFDAVIPRIGSSITFYGTAVVRQLEQMGVFTLNASHAISVSRDKLRASQILSRHNIGQPETVFVRDKNAILPSIRNVGGAPVIIKLLEGTQGIGVILADSEKIAQAIIEALHSTAHNVLIQNFVKESKGRDLRAFVVGDQVVAAIRRIAQGDEFRSNVHRGGRVEMVELDEEYERTAIQAAQIMGLQVAGVDMLEGPDGPEVMEVNSSPGLGGIESGTNIDIAGAIIEHLEEQILFPEIDLRERLVLNKGYAVVEIPITAQSELAHVKLGETDLRDRDVQVLSIIRGKLTIPNPNKDREILPGDKLLCFGKMLTLKGLKPPHESQSDE